MRKGIAVAGLIGVIVAVVVGLMVGYAMFPSITSQKNPCATYGLNVAGNCTSWTNTTPYTTGETSFLGLGTLFLALGLGVLGLKMLTATD